MQQSLQSPVWQKDTAAPRQPSLQQLYAQFQTSEKGLTSEEARKRLSTYGPNEPTSVKRLTTLQRLLVFVTNLLVLILLEKGLRVVHSGIIEGRKAFGNVMKYLLMGTSSNFGNMFSMAGASIFLPFLPMLPTQILLNNFLYDLSQVTISTDRVDSSYIIKPRRWDIKLIRNFMLYIGRPAQSSIS